jgi:hypothetical protein
MTNGLIRRWPLGIPSSFVLGHSSLLRFAARLQPPLGPGLHAGFLGLGLPFALGGAAELLGAFLAANALIVDLGPALGTMPVLHRQDKFRSGTHADHDLATFLLGPTSLMVRWKRTNVAIEAEKGNDR